MFTHFIHHYKPIFTSGPCLLVGVNCILKLNVCLTVAIYRQDDNKCKRSLTLLELRPEKNFRFESRSKPENVFQVLVPVV